MLFVAGAVAVDIHIGVDVERADGLDGVEGVVERAVVPEADVAERFGVDGEVGEGEFVVGGELALLDAVQPEGGAGGGDVALDVGRFAFEFVGLDGEALDDAGQDHRADDADRDQREDGGDGEAQALVQRPAEHAGDHDDAGGHQQILDGGADVVVGVGRAEDEAAGVDGQLEAGQPVTPDEHGHDGGDQQGEVEAGGERGAGLSAVEQQADAVHGGGGEHRHDAEADGPAFDELERFEVEDVEADVAPELRVVDAEGLGVEEEQDLIPASGGDGAEDDGEQNGDDDGDDRDQAAEAGIVDGRIVGVEPHAPGEGEAAADHGDGDAEAGEEEPDLGADAGVEDAAVADAVEPEAIDVEVDADVEQDQEDEQGGAEADDAGPPAARRLLLAAFAGGVGRRFVVARAAAAAAEAFAEDGRRRAELSAAAFVGGRHVALAVFAVAPAAGDALDEAIEQPVVGVERQPAVVGGNCVHG